MSFMCCLLNILSFILPCMPVSVNSDGTMGSLIQRTPKLQKHLDNKLPEILMMILNIL